MVELVNDLPRAVCSSCQGKGCSVCHNIGEAFFVAGRWVHWDTTISKLSIGERKLEQFVQGLYALLLALLGIGGLVLAYFALRDAGIPTVAPWDAVAEARGDGRLFLFAISLLIDVYLYYRLSRLTEQKAQLPSPPKDTVVDPQNGITLEEVLKLSASHRFAIRHGLTTEAYRSIEQAWLLAHTFRAQELSAPFLFASLLPFHKVISIEVRMGLNMEKMRSMLQSFLNSSMTQQQTVPAFGHAFREVMISAYRHGLDRSTQRIDVTELFLACAEQSEQLQAMFDELGIAPKTVENVVAWITMQDDLRHQYRHFRSRARFKPKGGMDRAMTAVATPYLDRLSEDLTAHARLGYYAPCIGREKEMDAMFRSLEDGKSVLLIGDSGVGKTALLRGIALRMVTEDVPKILQDKRLVSLSITTLVGSQSAQIGVEERLNRALSEVARAGNIVLVLENIQNLVGVSSAGAATLDLSEILASAIGSGHILALATTTTADFRKYVEPSAGMSSALTPLKIQEVDEDAAIRILEANAGQLEYQHEVFFSYAAIEKLVALATRYVHDQALPQKAITLMGEVATGVRKRKGSHSVITADDVAQLVSEKTNVPLTDVGEEEGAKLLHLEERIHERMVGQEEAVSAVSEALRRARVGLRDQRRPIVNLLFLGPTGVGKTQLAKTVAQVYFGSEDAMIRLDMSEYQEQSSLSQLVGAPPGYAGSASGGYLTDAIRRNPFSLVLLDELEKAHPDILNVFLQVMDDGRLTDSAGRTVDFTNVILIATSNAGTDVITEGLRSGQPITSIKQQLMERDLGRYFRPEFLNRFDQIVLFKPLAKSEIVSVAKILLQEVAEQLKQRSITLEASEAAIRELADEGFDPMFGARPLRRAIQEKVDNALAKYLLTGTLSRRDTAILEPNGVIRVERAPSVWQ